MVEERRQEHEPALTQSLLEVVLNVVDVRPTHARIQNQQVVTLDVVQVKISLFREIPLYIVVNDISNLNRANIYDSDFTN